MSHWPSSLQNNLAKLIIASSTVSVIISIIFSCTAGAANKNFNLMYSSLFRQVFERSFFSLQTGRAFYLPFQIPQCRNIRDNINHVDVTIREDIDQFIMYAERLKYVAANINNYIAVLENFALHVTCDPFFIDLTEQGINQDKMSLEFSITYYKQIKEETIRRALMKVSGLVFELNDLEIDDKVNQILRQNLPYGKDDNVINLMEWDALAVENITIVKQQCDHVFDECTIIVRVKIKNMLKN